MIGITNQSQSYQSFKGLAFILLSLLFFGFSGTSYAAVSDSTFNTSKTVTPVADSSSGGSSCNYYAQDTYGSTELPSQGFSEAYLRWGPGWVNYPIINGSYTTTWSGGTNSSFATGVTCPSGTYQVVFSLQIQATNSVNPVTISPCVQTTDGATTIYGACPAASGGAKSFTFNPACNGGYYCGVMTYYFAAQVTLTAGQMVAPPSIYTNGQINLTGGEFMMYLVSQ